MPRYNLLGLPFWALWVSAQVVHAQPFVYNGKVRVADETRIDWLYPVLGHSPAVAPEGLLGAYASSRQTYELYAPRVYAPGALPLPLILHVSFTDTPRGWQHWGPICARHGVVFAGPRNAGNRVPPAQRVRIVLDVLDDVRRRYPIDPDRTYLVGYSGGGFTAARIATALPEYFGGVVASNAFAGLPPAMSRLQRVRERLSVVMLAGARERRSVDVGQIYGPIYAGAGVRTLVRVYPRLGHTMPDAGALEDVYLWLEAGVEQRRTTAHRFPASRVEGAPTRQQQAALVLAEAKGRLEEPGLLLWGMMQLEGLKRRWPDLPEAGQAEEILAEHKSREDRPWEAELQAEQLRIARLNAERFESAARTRRSGISKAQRALWAQTAMDNWRLLIQASDDATFIEETEKRFSLLERIAANTPRPIRSSVPAIMSKAAPVQRLGDGDRIPSRQTVSIQGQMSVRELIDWLGEQLAPEELTIEVDEEAIRDAGLTLDWRGSIDYKNARPDDVLRAVLAPIGLRHQCVGKTIRIFPEEGS
ncbi:MAG: hypothetical protein ACYTG0_04965 [Planctomycetota bacterium]|jgi:dienelactone hydrolase